MLPNKGALRLDMTPMVDVAFLLLIFFMSTASLRAADESTVTLPTSRAGAEMPRDDQLVITVKDDGSILFSPGKGTPEPIGLEFIGARVNAARAQQPEMRVLVFADGEVPYGTMTEVLQTLQRAEVYRFALVTESEEG
jgi:biopolymer transport protein ExbD